jgi:alpha-L-fucosidase
MAMDRRRMLQLMGSATAALAVPRLARARDSQFAPTRESLHAYQIPDWFRDAKFGIWSHWGPQSAIERGDWYARNMYMQGSDQYLYQTETYGHPSKVGYKDLVNIWKAERWDPDHLMSLYKKAGAKYFFSMGVHHDNFDLWDSKFNRWNAVNMGPKRDVVGTWQKAAQKQGLRFGVSEHLWISYKWWAVAHGADKTGPLAGVAYDGADPKYADLYHDADCARFVDKLDWNDDGIPDSWKRHYLDRMTDLIDKYHPDILYTDGHLPFEDTGLKMVAHLYNTSMKGGRAEAVYTSKDGTDCAIGTCLLDHERGVAEGISANPWQTDTCIGDWHYNRGEKYKSAKKVIDLLTDIVSKNGNLLLNFPLPASGELDAEEQKTLAGITEWMSVNGEGVFATRPWKIFGEGPATKVVVKSNGKEFDPNEGKKPDLGAKDIRFTTKGETLYAFVQGWPEGELVIESLALNGPQRPRKGVDVRLLGRDEALRFTHDAKGLRVTMPGAKPATADVGIALRVRFV